MPEYLPRIVDRELELRLEASGATLIVGPKWCGKTTTGEQKAKSILKMQDLDPRIQDCRSSGLSVRAWCRQEEINAATYYRWERELLALAETEPCSSVSAVRFAELPAPKQVSRNVAERSATLHIGNASLDIYPGCDTEQLKMLVELLRLC